MSSRWEKNHYIQEEFQEILANFTKTIMLYKPKNIIDFAINYFTSLEKKIPLDQLLEKQNNLNSFGTETTLNNENSLNKDEDIDLEDSISQNNDSKIKVPISEEFKKFIGLKKPENKRLKNESNELETSQSNSQRDKIKDFVSELFIENKWYNKILLIKVFYNVL